MNYEFLNVNIIELSFVPGTCSCLNESERLHFILYVFFFIWRKKPLSPPSQWARASSFTRFLDHTQRRTTVGIIPLDERSARGRNLYLTTHDIHNRQTSMSPGGIRTHNLRSLEAADLLLRPRGH